MLPILPSHYSQKLPRVPARGRVIIHKWVLGWCKPCYFFKVKFSFSSFDPKLFFNVYLFILRNFCHRLVNFESFYGQKQILQFFPDFYCFHIYDVIVMSQEFFFVLLFADMDRGYQDLIHITQSGLFSAATCVLTSVATSVLTRGPSIQATTKGACLGPPDTYQDCLLLQLVCSLEG